MNINYNNIKNKNEPVPTGAEEGRWYILIGFQGDIHSNWTECGNKMHEETIRFDIKSKEAYRDSSSQIVVSTLKYHQVNRGVVR